MDGIREIVRFQTEDGEHWPTMEAAVQHKSRCEIAAKCNDMLFKGYSFADILRQTGRTVCHEVLEKVTKNSQLVISHWQGRDNPGYKPIRFTPHGKVFVHGNAGSWSGSYGGEVSVEALIRYAKDPRSLHPDAEPKNEAPDTSEHDQSKLDAFRFWGKYDTLGEKIEPASKETP